MLLILFPKDPPSDAPLLKFPVIVNSTAVRLSWEKLNCTEHRGIITGYSILLNVTGEMQSTVNVTADTTSIELSQLIELKQYSVSVAAINANGIGPYSEEHNVYTGKKTKLVLCSLLE